MNTIHSTFLLIGRALMSVIFFYSAYQKITHWNPTLAEMAAKNIPETSFMLFLVCVIEFIGAIALLIGFKARWAAFLLAIIMIPSTYLFNDFWNMSGGSADLHMIYFLKNIAIIGGLLSFSVSGAGAFSLGKE